MSERMYCATPSSVLRSAPVNSRQEMVCISASKRRRNVFTTSNARSPSPMVSPLSILRPIAITAPATAPQTAPVLPIPPAKPKAIRGMLFLSTSILNSWHTAKSTASAQTYPWVNSCTAGFVSMVFHPFLRVVESNICAQAICSVLLFHE